MKIPAHNSPITGSGYGYVYVMSYPGSDKVKIGHSLNPTTRAKEIGGTLAPETPQLQVAYWCSERREDVERQAHAQEKHRRHNGEWFGMSVTDAMKAISSAARYVKVGASLVFDQEKHAEQEQIEMQERARLDKLDRELAERKQEEMARLPPRGTPFTVDEEKLKGAIKGEKPGAWWRRQ